MSLSIVIPAYNEAGYLPTLLSSLNHARRCFHDVKPDYPVEIIVVDNCSSDETAAIAQSYHVQLVTEQKRNVATVRNRGALASHGKYLVFIDADYRVEGDFMTGIVSAFEADGKDVALGVRVVVEERDLDLIQRGIADFALILLARITHMSFGVFAFRRDFFEHLGRFDEQFFAYEDVELHRKMRRDLRQSHSRYRVLHHVKVHASGRGFYRGGMLAAYVRMWVLPRSRLDPDLCRYWYDR